MLLSFVLASFLLSLSPGPDNVFVLLHSAVHGRKAGLLVVLGLCSGLLFHTAAVALGLAALLAASAAAFMVLKLVGAGYLLYLAWGAWNAPAGLGKAHADEALSPLKTYLRGVIMNVTQPESSDFLLAFLPQFVDAERGDVPLQIAFLGFVFGLTALLTFGVIAWFAARFGAVFQRSERAHVLLNRTAAVVFTGLAARLAFSSR